MNDTLWFLIFRYSLIVLELSVFILAFLFTKPRKKLCILKASIVILIVLGIVIGLTFGLNAIYKSVSYDRTLVSVLGGLTKLLIFLLLAAGFYFCFKTTIYELGSIVSFGYAAREIFFCTYSLIFNFINPDLFLIRINQQNLLNFVLYFAIFAIFFVAVVFLIRKDKKHYFYTLELPTFIILAIVIVLNAMLISFAEAISDEHMLQYSFVLISNIIVLTLIMVLNYYTQQQIILKSNNELIKSMLNKQSEQYKFAKANAELMHVKAHDLKHQVEILKRGGPDAEKLLNELSSTISNYESVIITDNNVMNIILSEKWQYCVKHEIKLSCAVDPKAFEKVDNVELYTMLANILDNAIEAVMKIKQKDKRIISLNITCNHGLSILSIYNYFNNEIRIEGGVPLTSKKDKKEHGFGFKSIKNVVEKHGGTLTFETDNDIFRLQVTIPE